MMELRMFDTPVLPRLATVLAEVKAGELVVPAFQRPFVWEDQRRLRLLDSIAQGMPIGSILVWRTANRELQTYSDVGGVPVTTASKSEGKISYLLDGHQRISTLLGALYGGGSDSDDEDFRRPVYFDLASEDRPAFVLLSRGDPKPEWLPLNILFNGDKLFDFTLPLRQRGQRELARRAENLANVFRDYIIPIVPLVTDELDVVTDAFVRINSEGQRMTEAHMLRALTYLKPIDTDERFETIYASLQQFGWGSLDDQVFVNILKCLLDLNIYDSDVRRVFEKLKETPQMLDTLEKAVLKAASSKALTEMGVLGPAALPYAYQFVAIATIAARDAHLLDDESVQARLRRWLWGTTYAEHFSGITGSRIRASIDDLHRFLKGGEPASAWSTVPFKPLKIFRAATGRAKAFSLFLAQIAKHPPSRRLRQELLANDHGRAVSSLFPKVSATHPGNVVLASPDELRMVRNALKSGVVDIELRDALGIPDAAMAKLPDADAFVEARRAWLEEQERAFVAALATE